MPDQPKYQFFVHLFVDGDRLQSLGQAAIGNEHWSPAQECLRFNAACHDRRQPPTLPVGPLSIEPLWHKQLGQPYVDAFRAEVQANGTATASEFPVDYFADVAEQLTRTLRDTGKLEKNTNCRYLVCAFPHENSDTPPRQESTPRWSVTPQEQALVLREESLDALLQQCEPYGDPADDEIPVLVPQHVLDETIQLHELAGAAETGGTLAGHLCRDTRQPDRLFALVTAQVPVRHARQDLTSLTFTAESWADVDGVLRLRGGQERKLGWWHTHPARRWCEQCPVENRQVCKLSGEFFSQHDAALHRAAYPMAFSFALVISDSYAHGLTWPLYGWRRGVLARRGFHRLMDTLTT